MVNPRGWHDAETITTSKASTANRRLAASERRKRFTTVSLEDGGLPGKAYPCLSGCRRRRPCRRSQPSAARLPPVAANVRLVGSGSSRP